MKREFQYSPSFLCTGTTPVTRELYLFSVAREPYLSPVTCTLFFARVPYLSPVSCTFFAFWFISPWGLGGGGGGGVVLSEAIENCMSVNG